MFVSFVVVFLASIGLNPKEIGVIRGIQSLIFFIVSPATGILSDRFDIHKPVLLLGISGMSICYSSIALLSKYYSDLNENLYATVIVNRTKAPFHEDNLLDYKDYSNKKFLTFGGSLLLVSLGEICYAGVPPLLDSNTQTLVRMTSRCSFGQQRFWGSVGSIVLLTVTGYMLNIVNQNFTLCYEFIPAFLVFILCEFLCLIPAWFIPLFPQESRDKFLRAHLCEKFRHPRFAMILLVAFVLGMTSTQDTFKYLLLAELDASHLNRSLCIVFNCLGELPVMWYSKRFLKLLGNENAICFVTFVWIIRLGLYCVITNPWLILPVEFLHGVCHGLWSPALTSFCREISLTKIAVSVLAVANGVHTGIGKKKIYFSLRPGIVVR